MCWSSVSARDYRLVFALLSSGFGLANELTNWGGQAAPLELSQQQMQTLRHIALATIWQPDSSELG